MAEPSVSVIIPVYNRAHCVRRAVDSVLAQTHKDFEIVAVDDGSQDGSVEILRGYGDAIRLIAQPNAGAAGARNTGIRAARGRWIAFLDSDDEWRAEKLATQMAAIGKYGARVCFSRCVAEDGQPLADLEEVTATELEPGVFRVPEPLEFLTKARSHPYLQSLVVEKSLFERAGYFEPGLIAGEDTLWLFKLSFLADGIYVDRPMTVIHRYTGNSLTYDARPEQAEKRFDAFIRLQREMCRRLQEARPEHAALMRRRLAYSLMCRSELASAAGQNQLARSLAREAVACAGDFRAFVRGVVLWSVPGLCRSHFRKKWYRQ